MREKNTKGRKFVEILWGIASLRVTSRDIRSRATEPTVHPQALAELVACAVREDVSSACASSPLHGARGHARPHRSKSSVIARLMLTRRSGSCTLRGLRTMSCTPAMCSTTKTSWRSGVYLSLPWMNEAPNDRRRPHAPTVACKSARNTMSGSCVVYCGKFA